MATINDQLIRGLQAPFEGNRIVYDSKVRGFGVRITANGIVSFILNYSIDGRERRYTIGRHPEMTATAARAEAETLRGQINAGEDPLAARERRSNAHTVAELAKDYMELHALPNKRPSSIRNDRQMLDKIVLPQFGKLKVHAVTWRDLAVLKQSLAKHPYRANRVLSLVSKMFDLGIEWGLCDVNPAEKFPRFKEQPNNRWLSMEEIMRLSEALDAYPDQIAANAIRLLLVTGAREMEVLAATWDMFDLKRGIWTKPSHHTKHKREEHVPLGDHALDLLRRMAEAKTGLYLFPGATPDRPRVTIRRPWVQVLKAAGLVEKETIQGKRGPRIRYIPAVRIHTLRHTFASHLVTQGLSLHIVGQLLGHVRPETTQRYAHLSDASLRDAANHFPALTSARAPVLP